MADMNKLLGQLLGSGAAGGFAGGLAGGLASSMLTSKSGRKLGKQTLKMGGIAAVGALAYAAYQRYSTGKGTAPDALPESAETVLSQPPEGSAFLPPKNDPAAQETLGLTLVRAMIAAARSDGRLDAQESQVIFQRIESLGMDPENQALLVAEMGRPVDMDAIVNSADSPEVAAELPCFTACHRCGYRRREVLSRHAGRTSAAATSVGSLIEPPGGDANDS